MRFKRRPSGARRPRPAGVASRVALSGAGIAVLSGLGAACAGDAGGGSAGEEVIRRDSAGVEIVESAAPSWTEGTDWLVAAEPRVTLGAEDDPLYQIYASTRLSDGRFAVLDGGNKRVVLFRPDGTFEAAVGREGDGPGEFRIPRDLDRLPGDTLRVWDFAATRLTDLGSDGELARTLMLEATPEGGRPVFAGTLADGRLVVQSYRSPSLEDVNDGDLVRATWRLWTYGADGHPMDSIGSVPDAARMVRIRGEGDERQIGMVTMPFRVATPLAVGTSWLEAASNDAFELRRYAAEGGERRIARWGGEVRALTPERFDAWLEGLEYEPERIARIREQAEGRLPDRTPAHDRVVVDEEGNAWLRIYPLSPGAPSTWTVIAASGEWLGSVDLPPRFDPHEIGDDYVLGVWHDELDVERVLVHDLIKP